MATIWNYPTRIRFGLGEVQNTGNEASELSVKRALIVTDMGVAGAGLVDPVKKALEVVGIETAVFDQVEPNPTEANVEAGAVAYKAHRADVIVGVGGGSPLDVAKLVAVRATVALPFEALDDAKGGDRFIPKHLPPVIAIPTTAGTGSEVGRAAVLTVESTGRKTVVFSPAMLPRVALLDPELTRSMPARTTAATGFDALTHCLEALVARGDHPMAEAIAERGLELVWSHLIAAVENGANLEARGGMMKAAMMGAVAFQKGLGACHSLAHPLSSEHGLHHGLANAVCLPAVVRFNLPECEVAYADVARAFGGQFASDLPEILADFRAKLGLPGRLSECGIAAADLDHLADLAVEDACHGGNPRTCDRDALRRLYAESL
jgi:alcohol dehydrogenase class IV